MIPCSVAGPLGVAHLPRLWLKVSLEARGKLAAGYPGIGKGFDQMVISGLGLSADAVKKFIAEKKPSYSEFEAWVKAQPGVKLDRASVYKLNQSILGIITTTRRERVFCPPRAIRVTGPFSMPPSNLTRWMTGKLFTLRSSVNHRRNCRHTRLSQIEELRFIKRRCRFGVEE